MKNLIAFTALSMIYLLCNAQSFSYNGQSLTPKGDLHVLIVFVGFDTTTAADDLSTWDHDKIPDWAMGDYNNVIDIDNSQIGVKHNLTDYFYTMSNGEFTLTGEIYPDMILIDPEYTAIFDTSGTIIIGYSVKISDAFSDARDTINTQPNATFNYDWSRFDNRKNSPNYLFDNSLYSNTLGDTVAADGKIDYIVFVARITGGSEFNGVSAPGVGGNLTNGENNYTIDRGHRFTTAVDDSEKFINTFWHEMMHTVYNCPHTWNVNGVVGNYYYSYNGWGFMAPYDAMECANSWERWWLNWITPQEITSNGTYILKDYMTEGDALRIKIPERNPVTETDQYLYIENHQMLDYWERKPFYADVSEPLSTGIYSFIASKGNSRTSPINAGNPYANMFKSLNAEGKADFAYTGITVEVPSMGGTQPIFVKEDDNPISGQSDFEMIREEYDDVDEIINVSNASNRQSDGFSTIDDYNDINWVAAKLEDLEIENTYSFTGDAGVAFQVNDEISLSGILPALNYPQYHGTPDGSVDYLDPYYLNGLKVKILSFNSTTKEYSIEVKFDDWQLRADKRWCGNIIMPADNDLEIAENVTVTLNKTGTPNRRTPDAVHGFFAPTVFTIEDGASMKLNENAKLIVDDYSTLIISAGAEFIIEEYAQLEVKNNAKIILEDGGKIIVNSAQAKIVIEDGGTFLLNGNDIQLLNTNAKIILHSGGTIQTANYVDFTFSGTGYLEYQPDGIFDLGLNSVFKLTGSSTSDLKMYITEDADLYISVNDVDI